MKLKKFLNNEYYWSLYFKKNCISWEINETYAVYMLLHKKKI